MNELSNLVVALDKPDRASSGVTILGSTGTVGVNTLDVIRHNPGRFHVVALSANTNVGTMTAQCLEWSPRYAVMADESAAERLRTSLQGHGLGTEVLAGVEGMEVVASLDEVEQVMAAIVGAAGLLPTLAAGRAGKRVLLANKEALVMSGPLFMDTVREHGATLLPIDSEHNAIFQCYPTAMQAPSAEVSRILLTGSGGPFRGTPLSELSTVTPSQAVKHPNWSMGPKISVDSATMMNKGLEVIEGCFLFDVAAAVIEVLVHPQSVIHSMVEYVDGSVLAQLGHPDMRTPIAHALAYPSRVPSGVGSLDFAAMGSLEFEAPDLSELPCLRMGFEAARAGDTAPAVLNAANEVAVEAFLGRRIRFPQIPEVLEHTLERVPLQRMRTLDDVLGQDALAREVALAYVSMLSGR